MCQAWPEILRTAVNWVGWTACSGLARSSCQLQHPLLQTLITAVGQTVYTVASVLTLLFVLMFIFAILGFCLFGTPEKGDLDNWGNLASAFFTLFSLATVLCLGTVVRVDPGEGLSRRGGRVDSGPLLGPSPPSGAY